MGTVPQQCFTPFLPPSVAYIKGQLEVGNTTGYVHWQLIVYFSRKVSLRFLTSLFGNYDFRLTRSAAASAYVWKELTRVDGTQFEFGELPFKRNSAVDWARVRAAAVSGDIESIPDSVYVQHFRTLRAISSYHARPVPMVRECYVFWGPTATGKSRRAWNEAGLDTFPKDPRTKWWDGYQNHEHVIVDEFRGSIDIGHMLRWTDRYPVNVEIKGGTRPLMATKIWLTSNLHPRDWYPEIDSATMDALLRRLNITEFLSF